MTHYASFDAGRGIDRTDVLTDAATLRRLQGEANSLPSSPNARYYYYCPFDDGSYFRVAFVYELGAARTLYVDPMGCQGVSLSYGGEWVRWSLPDPRFVNDLQKIEGVPAWGNALAPK